MFWYSLHINQVIPTRLSELLFYFLVIARYCIKKIFFELGRFSIKFKNYVMATSDNDGVSKEPINDSNLRRLFKKV